MPEYTDYANIPIPLWPEADQVPVDLKNAFTVIDPLLVLRATNAADRDSQYGDVPAGTLVTGTEVDAIWKKRKDGSWATVYYDSGWKSVTLRNGWTAANTVAYRVLNLTCYWRGILVMPGNYTPAEYSAWCNVPSEAQPVAGQRFPATTNNDNVTLVTSYSAGQFSGWASTLTSSYFPVPHPYVVAGS